MSVWCCMKIQFWAESDFIFNWNAMIFCPWCLWYKTRLALLCEELKTAAKYPLFPCDTLLTQKRRDQETSPRICNRAAVHGILSSLRTVSSPQQERNAPSPGHALVFKTGKIGFNFILHSSRSFSARLTFVDSFRPKEQGKHLKIFFYNIIFPKIQFSSKSQNLGWKHYLQGFSKTCSADSHDEKHLPICLVSVIILHLRSILQNLVFCILHITPKTH